MTTSDRFDVGDGEGEEEEGGELDLLTEWRMNAGNNRKRELIEKAKLLDAKLDISSRSSGRKKNTSTGQLYKDKIHNKRQNECQMKSNNSILRLK